MLAGFPCLDASAPAAGAAHDVDDHAVELVEPLEAPGRRAYACANTPSR